MANETLKVKKTKIATKNELKGLANRLGVSVESLEQLEGSIFKAGWLFPMRDGKGEITGYHIRWFKGGKGVEEGGHLGLFIPKGTNTAGIQIITEGMSDLAVALDLGFCAIGRPCASACVPETVEYLRP